MNAKFKFDFNLDDPTEREWILSKKASGQRLAGHLGFVGKGAAGLANDVLEYCKTKNSACAMREAGLIQPAIGKERKCEKIYKRISAVSEAW